LGWGPLANQMQLILYFHKTTKTWGIWDNDECKCISNKDNEPLIFFNRVEAQEFIKRIKEEHESFLNHDFWYFD